MPMKNGLGMLGFNNQHCVLDVADDLVVDQDSPFLTGIQKCASQNSLVEASHTPHRAAERNGGNWRSGVE